MLPAGRFINFNYQKCKINKNKYNPTFLRSVQLFLAALQNYS